MLTLAIWLAPRLRRSRHSKASTRFIRISPSPKRSSACAKICRRAKRESAKPTFPMAPSRRDGDLLHRLRSAARLGNVKARGVTPNPIARCGRRNLSRRFHSEMLKKPTLVPSQLFRLARVAFVSVEPDNNRDLRTVKPGQRQEGDLTVIERSETRETVVVTASCAFAGGAKVAPQSVCCSGASTAEQSAPSKSSL